MEMPLLGHGGHLARVILSAASGRPMAGHIDSLVLSTKSLVVTDTTENNEITEMANMNGMTGDADFRPLSVISCNSDKNKKYYNFGVQQPFL